MLHLTGYATIDLWGETGDEWGPTEAPQVPSWKGRHKALTKLAVLPYIAHGAGASIAPAEVLAGSPILAGTKKARGGHWKKSRAKNETRASPLPLPAGHKKELQGKGLKASTELLTVRPIIPQVLACPPQTYRSRSAGRCSLGGSHTCTCRCSGNRCLHSGRAPMHRGPAYLGAQGGREPGEAAATCPPCGGGGCTDLAVLAGEAVGAGAVVFAIRLPAGAPVAAGPRAAEPRLGCRESAQSGVTQSCCLPPAPRQTPRCRKADCIVGTATPQKLH